MTTVRKARVRLNPKNETDGHVECAIIPLGIEDPRDQDASQLIIIPSADDFFPTTVQKDCLPRDQLDEHQDWDEGSIYMLPLGRVSPFGIAEGSVRFYDTMVDQASHLHEAKRQYMDVHKRFHRCLHRDDSS